MSSPKQYEGWTAIFSTSTDFEADLVRDRLDAAGLPAVVLTHRDHAFNLNIGDLAGVHVMVPPEHEAAALDVINEAPLTDEELTHAAMAADPSQIDAHSPENEAALDSGMESIRLSVPDPDEEE